MSIKRPDPRSDRVLRDLASLKRRVRDLELRPDLVGGGATFPAKYLYIGRQENTGWGAEDINASATAGQFIPELDALSVKAAAGTWTFATHPSSAGSAKHLIAPQEAGVYEVIVAAWYAINASGSVASMKCHTVIKIQHNGVTYEIDGSRRFNRTTYPASMEVRQTSRFVVPLDSDDVIALEFWAEEAYSEAAAQRDIDGLNGTGLEIAVTRLTGVLPTPWDTVA